MSEYAHSHSEVDDGQPCPICYEDHMHYGAPLDNNTIKCVICSEIFQINETVKLVRKKVLPLCLMKDQMETTTGSNNSQITVATTSAGTSTSILRQVQPLVPLELNDLRSKLISVSCDKQIRLRELHTGIFVRQLVGHTRNVTCFDLFGENNNFLLSGSTDQTGIICYFKWLNVIVIFF